MDDKYNDFKSLINKIPNICFRIYNNAPLTISIFVLLGIFIPYQLKLTMGKDAWFWFFSSIAQTFAALAAIMSVFFISRIDSYNNLLQYKNDLVIIKRKKKIKKEMKILLLHTFPIILISIILMPFGSLSTENSFLLDNWSVLIRLKWVIIFIVIGLCSTSTIKILRMIADSLSEPEYQD